MPKTAVKPKSRRVRLFRNGRNQAIRIPREFELPGTEVTVTRENSRRLVIEAAGPKNLLDLLKTLKPIREKLPRIPDLPPEPFDL